MGCLISLGRPGEAEADVDWLLRRLPGNPKVRMVAAHLYSEQGRRSEAIREVAAALAIWRAADIAYAPAQHARALLIELTSSS